MQKYLATFCLFFSLAAGFTPQPAYSQNLTPVLSVADSLYAKGNYLNALTYYRQLLESGQEYTPQMLLKMAFMEEALHHYDYSMYYLNLYYNLHPNRAVLQKMEEVAHAQGLTGYQYRDLDFFLTQFRKYYLKVLEVLLAVAVISVTIMALKRKQEFFRSRIFKTCFLVYLALLLVYINVFNFRQHGITSARQAAIMGKPSAAGTWLATLNPGHRLTITGENDIWYEIDWQGRTAFIRKHNLLVLPF